jgi:hypothetical protein
MILFFKNTHFLMTEIYENEIEDINKQISVVHRLNDVNKDLRKYNWIFLHPYCQV